MPKKVIHLTLLVSRNAAGYPRVYLVESATMTPTEARLYDFSAAYGRFSTLVCRALSMGAQAKVVGRAMRLIGPAPVPESMRQIRDAHVRAS
jgi:hypothetical protein